MRVRVEYQKAPEIKYLSHLDLVRVWERMLRRSDLGLQMSEGFNPHPKLSLGTVLPVGVWGKREYLDFELAEPQTEEVIFSHLKEQEPPGVKVLRVKIIADNLPSLMARIDAACYRMIIPEDVAYDTDSIIAEVNGRDSLPVYQKNKNREVDIRPGLLSLKLLVEDKQPIIETYLSLGQSSVRLPDLLEILYQNGLPHEGILNIWREGNYIRVGKEYLCPMDTD